ncbi:MAG: rhodanese-like domain-containing protein [Archangiaceae bacterium]|nr:rhodanese-like domain-containing protein [Archangiaceae bacterium]
MKRILMSLVVSAALVPAAALACDGDMKAEANIKKVTIAELAKDKQARVFDANDPSFRVKHGTIPGAVLLTSSSSYDVKELGTDKNASLVFYCANTMCSASEGAAKRAVEAGFTNVAVLPDGLTGWKKAGQKTAPVKPNS